MNGIDFGIPSKQEYGVRGGSVLHPNERRNTVSPADEARKNIRERKNFSVVVRSDGVEGEPLEVEGKGHRERDVHFWSSVKDQTDRQRYVSNKGHKREVGVCGEDKNVGNRLGTGP